MNNFKEAWERHRAGFRPIGWMLRVDGAEHWLRFHSFPQSRRYADTPEERQILLYRQNLLATEVLGGEPCWLVQTRWIDESDEPDLTERSGLRTNLPLDFQFITKNEIDEDQRWNVHAVETEWQAGAFDELLCSIADERAPATLWMSSPTGAIFAPYDGGIDLFLPTQSRVRGLADAHADWLSRHPSGL
jgi:hypothetical protein